MTELKIGDTVKVVSKDCRETGIIYYIHPKGYFATVQLKKYKQSFYLDELQRLSK